MDDWVYERLGKCKAPGEAKGWEEEVGVVRCRRKEAKVQTLGKTVFKARQGKVAEERAPGFGRTCYLWCLPPKKASVRLTWATLTSLVCEAAAQERWNSLRPRACASSGVKSKWVWSGSEGNKLGGNACSRTRKRNVPRVIG